MSLWLVAAALAGAVSAPPETTSQTAAPATETPPAPRHAPLPAATARQLAPGVLLVPGQFVAGKQPDGNSLVFDTGDGRRWVST